MANFILERHKENTLRWWYEMRDRIDFDPPYQRVSGIWPTKNKSFLIDTILNGYDIPKFYVVDFSYGKSSLNKKNMMYAIIDGKQRFEAIIEFFLDQLKVGEGKEFTFERDPNLDLQGMKYSELQAKHPRIAHDFDNYKIDVIRVWSDQEDPIRSLFVRLNTQVPVNGAERRNAMRGPVMDHTRELATHIFFNKKIKFNTKRMADRNAAEKLLWIEFNGKLSDTKKADLDKFAEMAVKKGFNKEKCRKAEEQVKAVLDRMIDVFEDRDSLLGSSGAIPLYYWFIKHKSNKETLRIRPFLEKFEKDRKENSRSKESGQTDVDDELLSFDKLRRSPNDSKAMEAMFNILAKYFIKK